MPTLARPACLLLAVASLAATGCVRRVIDITSDPSGAKVWVNDREVGRTPCSLEFTYYGTYDVRLEREGSEPLMTKAEAVAPWWDTLGPDLIAEVVPGDQKSQNSWHFTLAPTSTDRAALIERAKAMGAEVTPPTSPEPPPPSAEPAQPTSSGT
jgi:hypothetical protein